MDFGGSVSYSRRTPRTQNKLTVTDPLQPNPSPDSTRVGSGADTPPQVPDPGAATPGREESIAATAAHSARLIPPIISPRPSWMDGKGPVIAFFAFAVPALVGLSLLAAWGIQRASRQVSNLASQAKDSAEAAAAGSTRNNVDAAEQSEAEGLLARVAAADKAAAQQVLMESESWTGRTHRTPRTDQLITRCLNSKDRGVLGAGVAAQLALDGVPRSESGVALLEQDVGNSNQRAWALWMLGALGNRGVDPVHTAKIIGSYLTDPDVGTRASAVDALSLVGTDETIPMLLDRFRNDPSPVVQERAACDVSDAGPYTHGQRMVAAATLVGWVDDSLLSAQQRTWAAQALTDISGQSFGANSSAWKSWYAQQSASN
jgi:hypothetical protein